MLDNDSDIKSQSLRVAIFLILTLLFPHHLQAKRHIRSLKHQNVKAIQIICDTNTTRNAGSNFRYGISITLDDGNVINTRGYLSGKVRWNNFIIETLGARVSRGKVFLTEETDLTSPDFIIIIARSKHDNNIFARARIEKNFISRIELFSNNNFAKAPGNSFSLGLTKTYNNGEQTYITKRRLVNKELEQYEKYVDGGSYYNGKFSIDNNIFNITEHHVGFLISHKENLEITACYEFLLDYIDNYKYSAKGASGRDGNWGLNGHSGSDGSTGANGYYGSNGGNGGHGSDGWRGPDLEVYADTYFDTILKTDLIKIQVKDLENSKYSFYLVNPKGGNISIVTEGGSGGDGGRGGRGGDGGDGGAGKRTEHKIEKKVPCNNSSDDESENKTCTETEIKIEIGPGGNGGCGGHGGDGGNGGYGADGGNIVAFYSSKTVHYSYAIKLSSIGGSAGSGGWGGSGGSGGRGGSGFPSGSSGSSGGSGSFGIDGYSGYSGNVTVYDWNGHLDF